MFFEFGFWFQIEKFISAGKWGEDKGGLKELIRFERGNRSTRPGNGNEEMLTPSNQDNSKVLWQYSPAHNELLQ